MKRHQGTQGISVS
jgi:outer membrane protein assembly factor BamA